MADGDPITLTVMVNGKPMTLQDFLQQASDAMNQANSIPSDAMVVLDDGTVESAAKYQADVQVYVQKAQQLANQYLDDFTKQMTVLTEDLCSVGVEMHQASDDIIQIIYDLAVAMTDYKSAAGNDDNGKKFLAAVGDPWGGRGTGKPGDTGFQALIWNSGNLSESVGNMATAMDDNAGSLFDCEQKTLAGFNRTVVDPRPSVPGYAPPD